MPKAPPTAAQIMQHLSEILPLLERSIAKMDVDIQAGEARIADLKMKRRQIDGALHQVRALIVTQGKPPSAAASTNSPRRTSSVNEQPLWMGALDVLRAHATPMTAGEVTSELERRGWVLSRNARKVVRLAMVRRPDLFMRNDDGLYFAAPVNGNEVADRAMKQLLAQEQD